MSIQNDKISAARPRDQPIIREDLGEKLSFCIISLINDFEIQYMRPNAMFCSSA